MKKWLLSTLLVLPGFAQAAITPEQLDQLAAAQQDQVVQWRRWFHANPELSNRELKTAEYIAQQLREGKERSSATTSTAFIAT